MPRLPDRIADTLDGMAAVLALRWRARTRAVTARAPTHVAAADATSEATVVDRAELVLKTIGAMLRNDGDWRDALAVAGWEIGAAERAAGVSLHQLLRELELLGAIVLHAAERCAEAHDRAADAPEGGPPAEHGPAAALRLARRLTDALSLLTRGAAEGWLRRSLDGSREAMRLLRHDLRNPLGTVRSALSLLDDETMPAAMRADPRYRTIALRNALALDALIRGRLGDATLGDWVPAWPVISLEDLALAVRRDLRAEAQARACDVVVGDGLPVVRADSAALEMVLGAALSALLRRAPPASRIAIELSTLRQSAAVVSLTVAARHGRWADGAMPDDAAAEAMAVTCELAARAGARVWADGALFVELPLSVAETRDDLARARQRDDV